MAKTTQRIPKKLKKNHIVGPIITFVLLSALMSGLVVALFGMIGLYTTQSKLYNEFERVDYMRRLYEQAVGRNDLEAAYRDLDASDRDYMILDKDGNILHQKGENTCSDNGYYVEISNGSTGVKMRDDTKINYVHVKDDGDLSVDYWRIIKMIVTQKFDEEVVSEDLVITMTTDYDEPSPDADLEGKDQDGVYIGISKDHGVSFSTMGDMSVKLPLWMDLPVGDQILRAKIFISINLGDFAILAIMVVVLSTLLLIILIVLIVYTIVAMVRKKRVLRLYITDPATEAYNWQGYLLKGEQHLRKGSSKKDAFAAVCLVFMNYRNYCMCHSVEEGDAVIEKIMTVLYSYMGKREILAHSAPAEFSMVLTGEDPDKVKMRLQSIILQLEKIDTEHVFHFQAGVDMIPVQKNKNDKPVKRKDFNLEEAYNNACTARDTMSENDGSGVAIFDEKLVEDRIWVDKVQEKQQQALYNEEFEVYYQPKYDPVTNRLRGAEALIRWQSPDYGFVPPGRIIPIFEKNGFITEIDHYMISHVARDQKRWLERGFQCVPVSVNVSRAHFIENDLAEQIRDMVDEAGAPHELVEIELTESAFFDDKNAIINTINKLKSYGFTVSMDDFGSGYSSLNSLKDMPLDVLKLDAEFFRGENAGERGEIVVKEAIRLAKNLNMRTVAEGVEVKEQVDFLAEQGCDMIQGYYFAKPMPKLDYEDRMKKDAEIRRAETDKETGFFGLRPQNDSQNKPVILSEAKDPEIESQEQETEQS